MWNIDLPKTVIFQIQNDTKQMKLYAFIAVIRDLQLCYYGIYKI